MINVSTQTYMKVIYVIIQSTGLTQVPGKHPVPGEKFQVLLIDMAARPYNKFKLISDNEDTEEAERL
jgi:hypothetical protein